MEREWHDKLIRQEELGELPKIRLVEALDSYAKEKPGQYVESNNNVLNRLFPTDLYIDEIKSLHLTKFKAEREKAKIGAQTIKHNFQVIRSAITWAKNNGYETADLEYPKITLPKHRLRYLSIEEEKRLLDELDPLKKRSFRPSHDSQPNEEKRIYQDNFDLVILLLNTGARYSEIANIQWSSIDLNNKIIHLWRNKVQNESTIFMTNKVYNILERRFKNKTSDNVFNNKKGGPRGYQAKGIRAAIKRADIQNFTIHDLRHTCASRLVQNGLSLYEVASILGHSDVSTTQIYAHLEQQDVGIKAREILENFGASASL